MNHEPLPIPASAYDMDHAEEIEERRTLGVLVDNEPGVLGRVVGLRCGFHIEFGGARVVILQFRLARLFRR